MDQHPIRQIPDDELVEIADQPQLWISKDGYVKTLRAGLVRAAHITGQGRSPYPLESANGTRVELAQMSRPWSAWGLFRRRARPEPFCLLGRRFLLMHRFNSDVLKRLSDSHSELRHFIDRGLWRARCKMADQAGGYLRGDQGSQFNGR